MHSTFGRRGQSNQSYTKGDDGKWPPLRHKSRPMERVDTAPRMIVTVEIEVVIREEDSVIQTANGSLVLSLEAIAKRIVRVFLGAGKAKNHAVVKTKITDIRPK